jgi:hypothetical protein
MTGMTGLGKCGSIASRVIPSRTEPSTLDGADLPQPSQEIQQFLNTTKLGSLEAFDHLRCGEWSRAFERVSDGLALLPKCLRERDDFERYRCWRVLVLWCQLSSVVQQAMHASRQLGVQRSTQRDTRQHFTKSETPSANVLELLPPFPASC